MSVQVHPPFAPSRWRGLLARAWSGLARKNAPPAATPWMEEYEPRLLYSADLAPHALLASSAPATEIRVLDASGEFAEAHEQASVRAREVVFVDAAVEDKNIVLNQILTYDLRQVEVITLEAGADGIAQISAALAGRSDIAALHILSHGADAELQLGNTTINAALLAARGGEIAAWGNALSASSDILLYGCDVAASTAGQVFVQQIAALTGADVAVSSDRTGHAALGGDWDLEYRIGTIEAHLALSQQAQNEWFGELAIATLTAVKDTHIQSAAPDNNFGASATLILDKAGGGLGNGHPLLQFDLSAIPSSSIINSATLQMQATSITASTVLNVYQLTQAWNEGTGPNTGASGAASWNDRVTGTRWTDAGGLPNAAPVVATLTTSAAGQHNWSITPLVQSWVNGSANHGLMLASTSLGTDDVIYSSREGATAPVLVVDYTPFLVDTSNDVLDGNTSSIAALLGGKGADGRVSLREAILAANNTPGTDTIRFGITGAGAQTINVNAGLVITDSIIIDGTQNNGASANGGLPAIILDGNNLVANGLTLTGSAGGSTIRGLVIRDFAGDGIEIQAGANGNTIAANFIGSLDASGTNVAGEGNTGAGVYVLSANNTIGGAAAADRNVISGNSGSVNSHGVLIDGPNGGGNFIFGNYIGTAFTGTIALGNQGHGILIGNTASNNATIGGVFSGQGNTIAFNGGDGIYVPASNTVQILRNSLYANTGLGIDLGPNGVTANDADDADGGANNLQNFPLLATANIVSATQIRVSGTLNSTPFAFGASFSIEFFSNSAADASGNGEGQTFLGSTVAFTNASGDASFTTTLTASVPAGSFISATATRYNFFFPTDTSEFSNTVVVTNTAPVLDASKSPAFGTINEDAVAPIGAVGTLVSSLVDPTSGSGLDNVTDPDSGALLGIAITAADITNGTWFYSINAGTNWNLLGPVANGNARLLAADAGTRLYFQPNADFNGTLPGAITFHAWDQTSGANGGTADTSTSGGNTAFSSTTDTASLVVNAVNDAPTATNLSVAETYIEDTALNLTNIMASDVDGGNITATLTLSNIAAGSLNTATSGAVTSTYNALTGVWTASGAIADVNTLLAGATFNPASNFNSNFTIATRISDGVAADITGSKAMTGTAVNDAPAVDLNGAAAGTSATLAYTENGGAVAIAPTATVSDVDSANFNSGSLSVAFTANGSTADQLTIQNQGVAAGQIGVSGANVTFGGVIIGAFAGGANGSTLVVTFNSATATTAAAQALIQRIQYSNTSDNPSTLARALSYTLNDGDGGASTSVTTATINVTAVNDAPVVDLNGAAAGVNVTLAYAENGAATAVAPSATVTDVDSAAFNGGTMTVAFTASGTAADQLTIGDLGSITVTGASIMFGGNEIGTFSGGSNGTNLVIALNNPAATPAAVQALVNAIQFSNTSDNPAIAARTLTYTVTDGDGGTSAVATATINVTAVNDAPVMDLNGAAAGTSATLAYTENAAAAAIAPVATVTDIDSANFNGGSLNLAFIANGTTADQLIIQNQGVGAGQIGVSGANVTFGGVVMGTVAGGANGSNLVITFTSTAATPAAVQALINRIQYSNNSDNPSTAARTVSYTLNEGGANAIATATINVTAVNDPPSATNLGTGETYVENLALNLIDIVVSDADSPNITATLRLSDPAAGSLNIASSGAVTSIYTAATGVWTASGAIANVNTLLAGLTFTPALNFNSAFNIVTSVSDGVAPAITGVKGMTGIAVNIAPTATNLSAAESYTEDTPLNLIDIVVSDTDSPNVTVTLTLSDTSAGALTVATAGSVTSVYDAGTGVWTASGAEADVNTLLADVIFNPAANYNAAFAIATTVSDGVAAVIAGTKSITGIPVNDAPVTTPVTLGAIAEDSGATLITQADLLAGASDVESASLTATGLAIGSGAGTLVDNGNGTWSYTPVLDDDTAVSFNYTITDGSLNSGGVASLDITPVNDAPVTTPVTLGAIAEDSGATLITQADLLAGASDVDSASLTASGLVIGSGAGTLVDNGDGTWSYTPALDDDTALNFSYTITDGSLSAIGSASLDITPVNDVPVNAPVTLTAIAEDSGARLITQAELLANASDVDGPALAATGLAISSGSGILVDNGNGTWSYTAVLDDDTAVSFSYAVTDGSLSAAASANLDITAVNDAPVSTAVTLGAMVEDGGARLITQAELLANATDVDSASLTATGLAIGSGAGTLVDNGDGTWRYTPVLDDDTGVSFNYTVTDGSLNAGGIASLDITPVNDAPVTTPVTLGAIAEDSGATLITQADLLAGASDVDSASLIATGLAIGSGAGTLVDNGDGTWNYTPAFNDDTALNFSYIITDSSLSRPGSASLDLTPVNDAPQAVNDTLAAIEDTPITYSAAALLGNDSDVDGPPLTIASVTSGTDGTAVLNGDGTVTFTPNANFNGVANFTYTVTDGTLTSNVATVTVNVAPVNDAPVAANDTLTATEDTPVIYGVAALLGNDSDVDGPPLTIASVSSGAGGTAVLNGDGTVTFTPNANFNGEANFTYTASDGTLTSNLATITVNVAAVNDAPLAVNDTLAATEDTAVTYSAAALLGNDSDVDGPPLTIASVSSGAGGTAVLNGDGTVTFTPNVNFNGVATFTYTASDGSLTSNAAAVAVSVAAVNDAPLAVNDTLTATEDMLVTYSAAALLGNDSDVDCPPLTIASVTSGTGGTAVLNGDGTVTFTPNANFTGVANFTYTASDSTLTSNAATVSINVAAVNDAPLAVNDTLTATEDTLVTYSAAALLGNDSDVDGPPLTIASVTSGTGGTAVLNGDGTVTFTPNVNFNGVATFTYTASDGSLTSNAAAVAVSVAAVNDAPVNTPVTLLAISEDSGARLITQAELLANASDVDGPALTAGGMTIASGAGTLVDNGNGTWTYTSALDDDTAVSLFYTVSDGSLTVAGSASLDITAVNDAPANVVSGPQTVNEDTVLAFSGVNAISASDVDGNLAAVSLAAGNGALNVTLAGGATISVGANDSGALTLSGTPAQINAALATLTYQAFLNFNGAGTLTVISTDDAGVPLSDSDSVIIAVAPVNDAALIGGTTTKTVTEDAAPVTLSSSGMLTITDADAGEAVFAAQPSTSGSYGTFTLNSNGAWTYIATNNQTAIQQLAAGFSLAESFTVSSEDGTAVRSVVIMITGANDVALIGGVSSGNLVEDSAPALGVSGALSIADVDSGQSSFLAQTNTGGAYGVFTVSATGAWTYTATNNQAAIQQLAAGATLTETFTAASADGSATQAVVVTVTGVNDAPTAADRSVSTFSTAAYVLGIGDFGFTDADGDSLARVRITALPGAGTLLLGANAVAVNQEIAAAEIAAGQLRFVPGGAQSSPALAAIGFQVNDGSAYSAGSNTFSVQISPNQLPVENPLVISPPVAAVPEPSPVAAPAAPAAPATTAPDTANATEIPVAQGAGVDTALAAAPAPDGAVVLQVNPGLTGLAEDARSRVAALGTQLLPPGGLTFTLGLGLTQVSFDPLRAAEAVSVAERTAAATTSTAFVSELNRVRESSQAVEELERNVIVSSVAAGAGMSVGYVLWLLRGGLLLSSLLSSLPAWRFVDPLPVLGRLRDEDEDEQGEEDDDSVESIVRRGDAERGQT